MVVAAESLKTGFWRQRSKDLACLANRPLAASCSPLPSADLRRLCQSFRLAAPGLGIADFRAWYWATPTRIPPGPASDTTAKPEAATPPPASDDAVGDDADDDDDANVLMVHGGQRRRDFV